MLRGHRFRLSFRAAGALRAATRAPLPACRLRGPSPRRPESSAPAAASSTACRCASLVASSYGSGVAGTWSRWTGPVPSRAYPRPGGTCARRGGVRRRPEHRLHLVRRRRARARPARGCAAVRHRSAPPAVELLGHDHRDVRRPAVPQGDLEQGLRIRAARRRRPGGRRRSGGPGGSTAGAWCPRATGWPACRARLAAMSRRSVSCAAHSRLASAPASPHSTRQDARPARSGRRTRRCRRPRRSVRRRAAGPGARSSAAGSRCRCPAGRRPAGAARWSGCRCARRPAATSRCSSPSADAAGCAGPRRGR